MPCSTGISGWIELGGMLRQTLRFKWVPWQKHRYEAHLRERRALDVLDRLEFAREPLAGVLRERLLTAARELLARGEIIAQVRLSAHQQERRLRAVMFNFRHPLHIARFTWHIAQSHVAMV